MRKKRIIIGDSEVEVPDLSPQWIIWGILAIFLLIAAFSSFYTVEANEMAVIQRFGKYVRVTEPGLHFKLPFGIETNKNVRTLLIFKEEFGFRTLKAGVRTQYDKNKFSNESLMLTGDLNSAEVEWIVQFRIEDAAKFLFNIRNPEKNLRDLSESVMRQIVGDHSVDEVISLSRREVEDSVEVELQSILDRYKSGIHIQRVQLQDVFPPDPVRPAFNEVNEAEQQKEKIRNEALEAYNKVIPKAQGTAQKTIESAKGYALKRVNNAKGDAERFISVYKEYARAKDVTRRRLYLEAMSDILPQLDQIFIIDPSQKNVVPLLQMMEKGGQK